MELNDRAVIISEKNMEHLVSLYGICSTNEWEQIINNMIDNAIVEINEDISRGNMGKMINCSSCKFMKEYDYGNKVYYCDHEDRTNDMGKLSVNKMPKLCPEWCPLRKKNE